MVIHNENSNPFHNIWGLGRKKETKLSLGFKVAPPQGETTNV